VNIDSVAAIGKAEIGLEIPTTGRAKLATRPEKKVIARLNPTEYNRLSMIPILWILRILRIRIPGMKVRKKKPVICLKPRISKPSLASPINPNVVNKMASDRPRHFLISQSLGQINYYVLFLVDNEPCNVIS